MVGDNNNSAATQAYSLLKKLDYSCLATLFGQPSLPTDTSNIVKCPFCRINSLHLVADPVLDWEWWYCHNCDRAGDPVEWWNTVSQQKLLPLLQTLPALSEYNDNDIRAALLDYHQRVQQHRKKMQLFWQTAHSQLMQATVADSVLESSYLLPIDNLNMSLRRNLSRVAGTATLKQLRDLDPFCLPSQNAMDSSFFVLPLLTAHRRISGVFAIRTVSHGLHSYSIYTREWLNMRQTPPEVPQLIGNLLEQPFCSKAVYVMQEPEQMLRWLFRVHSQISDVVSIHGIINTNNSDKLYELRRCFGGSEFVAAGSGTCAVQLATDMHERRVAIIERHEQTRNRRTAGDQLKAHTKTTQQAAIDLVVTAHPDHRRELFNALQPCVASTDLLKLLPPTVVEDTCRLPHTHERFAIKLPGWEKSLLYETRKGWMQKEAPLCNCIIRLKQITMIDDKPGLHHLRVFHHEKFYDITIDVSHVKTNRRGYKHKIKQAMQDEHGVTTVTFSRCTDSLLQLLITHNSTPTVEHTSKRVGWCRRLHCFNFAGFRLNVDGEFDLKKHRLIGDTIPTDKFEAPFSVYPRAYIRLLSKNTPVARAFWRMVKVVLYQTYAPVLNIPAKPYLSANHTESTKKLAAMCGVVFDDAGIVHNWSRWCARYTCDHPAGAFIAHATPLTALFEALYRSYYYEIRQIAINPVDHEQYCEATSSLIPAVLQYLVACKEYCNPNKYEDFIDAKLVKWFVSQQGNPTVIEAASARKRVHRVLLLPAILLGASMRVDVREGPLTTARFIRDIYIAKRDNCILVPRQPVLDLAVKRLQLQAAAGFIEKWLESRTWRVHRKAYRQHFVFESKRWERIWLRYYDYCGFDVNL